MEDSDWIFEDNLNIKVVCLKLMNIWLNNIISPDKIVDKDTANNARTQGVFLLNWIFYDLTI